MKISTTELSNRISVYNIFSDGKSGMEEISMKDLYDSINIDTIDDDDIQDYGKLHLRDLKRLDYSINPSEDTAISVRKHVVIFSIDNTRAIITANRLVFIVPDGADSIIGEIGKDIDDWAELDSSFEYNAYERLLTATKYLDKNQLELLEKKSDDILKQIKRTNIMSVKTQDDIKNLKNEISSILKHFGHIVDVLNDVYEDDEKQAFMNLTLLKNNYILFKNVDDKPELHEGISNLIEVFLIDYNNYVSRAENLEIKIKGEEDLMMIKLDTVRNQLMIINTVISIIACTVGFSSYVASIFGMNLDNTKYLQPVPGVFNGVVISTMIFMPLVKIISVFCLTKLKYISGNIR